MEDDDQTRKSPIRLAIPVPPTRIQTLKFPICRETGRESPGPIPDSAGTGNRGPGTGNRGPAGGTPGISWSQPEAAPTGTRSSCGYRRVLETKSLLPLSVECVPAPGASSECRSRRYNPVCSNTRRSLDLNVVAGAVLSRRHGRFKPHIDHCQSTSACAKASL